MWLQTMNLVKAFSLSAHTFSLLRQAKRSIYHSDSSHTGHISEFAVLSRFTEGQAAWLAA